MLARGSYVANGQAQAVLIAEHGVREEDFARAIDALEQGAVGLVSALQAEADCGERGGRGTFKTLVGIDLARQLLGPADVRADDFGDARAAVIAQHEPELQRSKTAAQRYAIIHVVHGAGTVGG